MEIKSHPSFYFAHNKTTYEDFNTASLLGFGRGEKDRKLQITVA